MRQDEVKRLFWGCFRTPSPPSRPKNLKMHKNMKKNFIQQQGSNLQSPGLQTRDMPLDQVVILFDKHMCICKAKHK